MTRFGLIGATALMIAVAAPATARDMHHLKHVTPGVAIYPPTRDFDSQLPVQDALRFGYSQGYQYYPSGYGGLYGDGNYPGNVISNEQQ